MNETKTQNEKHKKLKRKKSQRNRLQQPQVEHAPCSYQKRKGGVVSAAREWGEKASARDGACIA